ncbi:MAG: hypothetical protein JXQ23_13350 [Clostridia bacterium]|nr:hypothetical protein [Clostridia bacterium]
MGPIGAGKSTFSEKIACNENLKSFHFDLLSYHDAYQKKTAEEQIELLKEIKRKDQFVCEGLHPWHISYIYDKESTIIVLNYSVLCCLCRFLKRHFFKREKSPYNFLVRMYDLRVLKWILVSKIKVSKFIKDNEKSLELIILNHRREEETFIQKLKKEYT